MSYDIRLFENIGEEWRVPNDVMFSGGFFATGLQTKPGAKAFYVDSVLGKNDNDGKTPTKAVQSIVKAHTLCTASKGDTIHCLPGHVETISAAAGLVLSKIGVTVVFHGEGSNRAKIQFGTVVGADMDISAAGVTLINPRFVAALDALTGPIDVNAARFSMINAVWEDGTSINTTDCVVADADADELLIDGFTFIDGDAGGTQKQSFIQVAGATRPTIKNIRCTGDFGTGIIENGTAWIDATLENLVLDNASASPTVCVLLQTTSTGWARNSSLRVASGSTGYTASNDMQFDNVNTIGTDAAAASDPVIGGLADSAASGAVTTTDTAMAYIKQLVTEGIARDAAILAIDDFLDTEVAAILADTDTISGIALPAAPTADSLAAFIASGGTALGTELADSKSLVDAVGFDGSAFVAGGLAMYLPRCLEKSGGTVETGNDDLFVITGGPVRAKIVGLVTTVIGGASNGDLQLVSDDPAATVDLNASPVAIDSDNPGTFYFNLGATSVFTPSTGLAFKILDPVTVEEVEFLLAPGTVHFRSSAAQTGNIKWYMTYWPLSPLSVVTVAA